MKNNVIIFFTDQQRADTTGAHGNPCGLTPNFDRTAKYGTFPELSYTPQPLCAPARAVLQTGKYATTTGCYRNEIPLDPHDHTLAWYFNRAGYDTGYIGKWHLSMEPGAVPEKWRGDYSYFLGANALELTSQPYNTVVYDNDGKEVKLPGYRVDALTDASIRYIDEHKNRPFFLMLSFLEPHFQNSNDSYPPPDVDYDAKYSYMPADLAALGGTSWQSISGYYGMVKRLDQAYGRVLDALKSLGLSKNTIVLFASDHGCHFKTRNSEYKRSCHESSIRIPMALTGGPFTGGGTIRELVGLEDMAPTLLDACGIPVPEDMQGHSILPLVYHRETDWRKEAFIQISESHVGRALRTHRWKYAVAAKEKDGWNDSCSDVYEETELYDLEHDPYELTNLIGYGSHRKVADLLCERLKERMEQAGEHRPQIRKADILVPANQTARTVFPGEEYE
ncbi:MAG: sulfatase-like hydrolase/transferase [Clostridiales bacterium]|nr:sulfatase-like hydrolase/transferase [Clostridiales bacterium]